MVLENNVVRIVEVATRVVEQRFLESTNAPFVAMAWSPRGNRIATGTAAGAVQLWDADTLEPATPPGRQSTIEVSGITFSRDGELLASTSAFGATQLWQAASGAPIGDQLVSGPAPITFESIPQHDRPPLTFTPSFGPDGRHLVTGGDHPMRWTLDATAWRSAACEIAGRELTISEWARFLPSEPPQPVCGR